MVNKEMGDNGSKRELIKLVRETGEVVDNNDESARNYLSAIASAIYYTASDGSETPGDASTDVVLSRFDKHGNLSEDEFDTYRIEYKASENGGIGECHVYKIIPGEDDLQEATMQEITAQDANLDTCNTLGRIWEKLAPQQEPGGRNDR